ncbi:MAG TPA: pyruvate dehydrogenase (acetyl-transferring) E1 component subunit alpha [Myxococcales bacterium]
MSEEPSREQVLGMYRRMARVRRFEERAGQQYGLGRIGGFCHLYIGQEAVGVGAVAALESGDYVISGYREHGQALARDVPAGPLMAELFGKATGVSKGRGGSMHIIDAQRNFLGGYGIVGGQIPLAAGVGWAIRYRGEARCCLCFFGDAAINQGSFHESLNLVGLWKLPVVYVIENNRYGMGTRVDLSTSIHDLYRRAEAYEVPGEAMDGMDALDCFRVVSRAAQRARKGNGPSLLEARTYRFRGHSMSDPATYRTKEEVERERKGDPIPKLRARILSDKLATEADLARMEEEIKREVDEAVRFAEQSPEPGDADLYQDVASAAVPVERLRFTGEGR